MAASSSSSSPQRDTCLNFITHLLETLKHTIMNIFFHEQDLEDAEQLSQALPQTIVSSYSSRQLKHQVFLSFRGEDTRLNFTAHLLKALKDTGMNVFFDEEKLEKGEQLSSALSQAIAASNLSIIVLSVDYASSKSCLAEVSDIMDRKDTQGHIVLPIFYHVDPSNVRNIGGSFKTSFEDHELKRPIDEVKRWKAAFVEVEKMILGLIEQEDTRIIGLWGMGGIGKTTLADVVYKEVSQKFEDSCFLHNVSEKIEKQGMESLRDDFLTELLEQEIHIRTPSIGQGFIQERLNNKKVIVVLDDVNDSDLMNDLGVQYFGEGSKIIVTSRDKQVLKNGGANKVHEVVKLNENDSLQLFSIFAFRQLNPAIDFLNLSYKFVRYAQGSPLALKVLGSRLYTKSKRDWESEVDKLKEYAQPKISQILKRSFDGLDELEKNVFLDIACLFKNESKEDAEEILSRCYRGAVSGISNLLDKCLIDIITAIPFLSIDYCECFSMHDMLEEMGKDIVRQEAKELWKHSRLWIPKDVYQILRYNKGTDLIQGLKLDMSQIDNLQLCPTVFDNMYNLRVILFYFSGKFLKYSEKKLLADQDDSVSLPDELRYLFWDYYPFKSLSNFNPINLVVLKLPHGDMEFLWNEDGYQNLVNLREIDLTQCKNLRKIPNLLSAINLKSLCCNGCEILVEHPCLDHLAYLKTLELEGCHNLKKFPEVPNHFSILELDETGIEEVPDSVEHLTRLEQLCLRKSGVKKVSSNISKLGLLRSLYLSHCPITEFPKHSKTQTEFPGNSILKFKSLEFMHIDHCNNLKFLSELPPYLRYLVAHDCTSLEKVSFTNQNLYELESSDDSHEFFMLFSNCFNLNQDSINNIEANAMIKIGSLVKKWEKKSDCDPPSLVCCFPRNEISANTFEYQSMSSSLIFGLPPNGCSGRRYLVFVICLVADFAHGHKYEDLICSCECQLTATGGHYEKFKSEWYCSPEFELVQYMGDHVLILFSGAMVKNDKGYQEASFEFHIKKLDLSGEEEPIKVEKCGVYVSYVA
ncbi:TMV resistance protein N-like [Gossypium australe]|uniref:TMV resistance protein N-like n=1 Tax=Gossypium australe TaxID=47621 RepID=A0A5B6WLT6_9ROSI|nr:TMV resistance protein N-like [Gossypium australe]